MLTRILVLLCLIPAIASAAEFPALQDYFDSVKTLEGRFEQVTRDDTGAVVEQAEGRFAIRRPERFNWVYEQPYEQRIIADGRWLYVYDLALEQVSVRPLDEVLGVGPAVLLSGQYSQLTEAFDMHRGEGEWIRLEPVEGEWDFQSVRLRLVDGIPAVVEVEDQLGETTRVELSELTRNETVPKEVFQFQAPDGVDVIAPPGYRSPEGSS